MMLPAEELGVIAISSGMLASVSVLMIMLGKFLNSRELEDEGNRELVESIILGALFLVMDYVLNTVAPLFFTDFFVHGIGSVPAFKTAFAKVIGHYPRSPGVSCVEPVSCALLMIGWSKNIAWYGNFFLYYFISIMVKLLADIVDFGVVLAYIGKDYSGVGSIVGAVLKFITKVTEGLQMHIPTITIGIGKIVLVVLFPFTWLSKIGVSTFYALSVFDAMIRYFAAIFNLLIVLGFLLRTMRPTRGLGAVLISFAIGFGKVMPLMYVLSLGQSLKTVPLLLGGSGAIFRMRLNMMLNMAYSFDNIKDIFTAIYAMISNFFASIDFITSAGATLFLFPFLLLFPALVAFGFGLTVAMDLSLALGAQVPEIARGVYRFL